MLHVKHCKKAWSIKIEVFKCFEWNTGGIKCVKLSVNWKDSSTHCVLLRPTCTLWGSPVILRGLSAPVGMGSSWIIIICTPVLSCRGTIRQKHKHTKELHGAQMPIHSKRWRFCYGSKRGFYFGCNIGDQYKEVNNWRMWEGISRIQNV